MSEEMIQTPSKQPETVQRQNWRAPRYEVTAGKEEYELRVHLPGVPKKQAELTIENDQLLIVGRPSSARPEKARAVYEELPAADFRLQLHLNVDIDADKIEAHSEHGVLIVRLPLAEQSKPRAITVE